MTYRHASESGRVARLKNGGYVQLPRAPSKCCLGSHPGDVCPVGVAKWLGNSADFEDLFAMAVSGADLRVSNFVPFVQRPNRVPEDLRAVVSKKIQEELDKGWLVGVNFDLLQDQDKWAVAPLQTVVEPTKVRVVTDYSDVLRNGRTGINAFVDMES